MVELETYTQQVAGRPIRKCIGVLSEPSGMNLEQ